MAVATHQASMMRLLVSLVSKRKARLISDISRAVEGIMCPMEALRLGYDTPAIRAAAAQMQKQQDEVRAKVGMPAKSFGRVRMFPGGIVEYAKKGWEPPPDLDGYERDPGNAWRFLPKWTPCKKRIQTVSMKSCGAMSVLTVCANDKCPLKQQQVSFAQCSACQFRVTE